MSVLPSDIVTYGSANMPEADGSPVGGTVDFTRRIAFLTDPLRHGKCRRGVELGERHGDEGRLLRP